ncbi:MAG: 2-hydroxyacid dehydrogenase [Vicinamibacterales bacterium]
MNIFVTRKLPASVIAKLETVGHVEVFQGSDGITPEQLRAAVPGKHALVTMLTEQVDAALLDAGKDLKVVANVAVGYNNIDVAACRARGVVCTNTPDVLTESVADFTWALILAITRRLSEGERVVRRHEWKGWAFDYMLGTELRGKQLGLVGLGRIAAAVARRAPVFGMRVAYTSRSEKGLPGAERTSLDQLLNTSDIVSLHVPLTPDTRHLIDQKALTRMKRSAYLINTARGPVVDEAALAWALKERLIAGAALDVYEQEPTIHPGLFDLENVLLVPHLGSGTTETRTGMAELAADNVIAVLGGKAAVTPIP